METHILEQEAGRAKIHVAVPADDVSDAYQRVVTQISRQVRIPGFRPGKAPRGVLERQVGKDAIAQEVRDALVQVYYPRAVRELGLSPVSQTLNAELPSDQEAYQFEVELELYPEFDLPDVTQIIIDTPTPQLSDEQVQESIDALRRQHATLIPVERGAAPGDYVSVETLGEGESSSIPVDLDNVSPELAEQFMGKAIGDEIELTLEDETGGDDPAPPEAEEPAQSAPEADETPTTLRVKITDIKEKELPEPDDEFAQTLGAESWGEVEAQLRQSLEMQLAQDALKEQQDELAEKLMLETDVTVPQSLVARRRETTLSNIAKDLEARDLTLKDYLARLDDEGKRAEFDQNLTEAATKDVKRDMVLEKLMSVRQTDLSDEAFASALNYLAYNRSQNVAKLKEELGPTGLENYRFLLRRDKALRETLDELLARQRGEENTETPAEPDHSATQQSA